MHRGSTRPTAPKPSLFGVKKCFSSVRYSLFTNENGDLSLKGEAQANRDMATSTVRVINFSSQNCIQTDIQSPRPLPHMNLNVLERLIWALRDNLQAGASCHDEMPTHT